MKRAFDICMAAIGLVITSPLLAVISVLIKLDSSGPVIFRQIRVGQGFRPFAIQKFRTMVVNPPGNSLPLTVGEDIRITRVGRILRKFKLDELPQLLNVLVGDMSLVGPRPEVPRYVERLRSEFSEILVVRPGITDLASLRYIDEAALLAYSSNPEEEYLRKVLPEKLRLAKLYVRHMSLRLDFAIIIQTLLRIAKLPVVVFTLPELKTAVESSLDASLWTTLSSFVTRWRKPIIVVVDVALIILANYLAFFLRYDGVIPDSELNTFERTVLGLVAIRGVAFALFGLNESLWRYTSVWDLQNILKGIFLSAVVFYGWVHWAMEVHSYPRSVFAIDAMLLVGFLAGIRLSSRIFRDKAVFQKKRKVLVVGAGDSGERVVREMKTRSVFNCDPIGLVDDNIALLNQRIHGVRVLGTVGDIPKLVEGLRPEVVVVALPNATPEFLRDLVIKLEPYEVSIKTLPAKGELLADQSTVSQMRNISVLDLLSRAPIDLDNEATRQMVRGKCVLITGAGGSIGSELARQVSLFDPKSLLLYERHENSLYNIHKELDDQNLAFPVIPLIGDVTDAHRLCAVLEQHKPQILFHAAAHKHVPLVELNPLEAVKNNCLGTRVTAEAASLYGVEQFVHISTDKAVNPSSVMGATKRVAELIIQDIARTSKTRFLLVRFGNVLGSSGSVVLRFQEQIRSGGPVTVTHPEIRRYFMLIPEAVQLVLQAATIGKQGHIYILDMGEQIKVLDIARSLIRLSGFIPGKDITIRFVGLRPGEKLYEELVGEGEEAVSSSLDKILQIRTISEVNFDEFRGRLSLLEAASYTNKTDAVLDRLKEIVPTFRAESPTPELLTAPANCRLSSKVD
ncbi:MAG: polysaccharide biosynthesis protein [Nitrospira sp.]|nr:polysaccharide biosynthesis protein [Nitrospira sp.]MDH4244124.1 polysaccharide biosynthesis protein [Nitrospira sp.]MDH4355984.1 polysaccharide biosynthesis protein [Nitrospira sp.]MDH5317784.1 polysaccharide biosynthesis protein [Nitrospira sp.]